MASAHTDTAGNRVVRDSAALSLPRVTALAKKIRPDMWETRRMDWVLYLGRSRSTKMRVNSSTKT